MEFVSGVLLAGAAVAAKAMLSSTAKDAYQKLKKMVIGKSGQEADVESALAGVEKRPDSKGRQEVLKEELERAGIGADQEVLQLARRLQELLRQEGHPVEVTYQAHQSGDGAIAQGSGAVAAGKGGVAVGGDVHGGIRTGNLADDE